MELWNVGRATQMFFRRGHTDSNRQHGLHPELHGRLFIVVLYLLLSAQKILLGVRFHDSTSYQLKQRLKCPSMRCRCQFCLKDLGLGAGENRERDLAQKVARELTNSRVWLQFVVLFKNDSFWHAEQSSNEALGC